MNEIFKEMITYMLSYLLVVIIMFFIVNIQTKGYLGKFLLVKMSRGKKILNRVRTYTDSFYRIVWVEDKFLKTKLRDKDKTTISFPINPNVKFTNEKGQEVISILDLSKIINREGGISIIESNEGFTEFRDFVEEQTLELKVDPASIEVNIERIKHRPAINSKKETLVVILLLIVVAVVGFIAFRVIKVEEAIALLKQVSGNI